MRGFVYLLDIPKFLDGIFLVLVVVYLPVMRIAEKQQILIGPALLKGILSTRNTMP